MNRDLFNLSGKIIVLTGALGQLGRQYTGALLAYGARVAAIDILAPDSEAVQSYLAQSNNVIYIPADITQKPQISAALDRVMKTWGVAPSGLINNAALDSPPSAPVEENGPFETYPQKSLDKVLDVNLKGVIYCCQVFGGAMAKAGGGSIINISSIYGMVSPNQNIYEYRRADGETFFKPVAYSVSKSALLNLTRYLATYWAKDNVRVNTLTLAGVFNNQAPRFLDAYCRQIPVGRMANPDEYNGAIVFLVSDASAYMTGANMVMDGGWTAW
jgi:NAD(P)-dependent dehydrogenase (short-subunit alcohol dehydrogenase family)